MRELRDDLQAFSNDISKFNRDMYSFLIVTTAMSASVIAILVRSVFF